MICFNNCDFMKVGMFSARLFQRAIYSAGVVAALSVSLSAQIDASLDGQNAEVAAYRHFVTKQAVESKTGARVAFESDQRVRIHHLQSTAVSDVESGDARPLFERRNGTLHQPPGTVTCQVHHEPSFKPLGNAIDLTAETDTDKSARSEMSPILENNLRVYDKKTGESKTPEFEDDPDSSTVPSRTFHWERAIGQSIVMQLLQHTFSVTTQEKTSRALKGPFFSDYINSVKGLHGWDDGNRFFTNYIAHPMQGATTGFIFIQNHERAKRQKFAESKKYWIDRLKTLAWSAVWSTNWELGPVSQASIGNLGLNGKGMAYVDLVITPTVGTAWAITEEALDRFIIRHQEGRGKAAKILMRMLLNPMRSMANILRLKHPWYRDRVYYTAYVGS